MEALRALVAFDLEAIMSDSFIPISKRSIGAREKKLVLDALEFGWVSSIGNTSMSFESKLRSRYCGTAISPCGKQRHDGLISRSLRLGCNRARVIVPDLNFRRDQRMQLLTRRAPILADIRR